MRHWKLLLIAGAALSLAACTTGSAPSPAATNAATKITSTVNTVKEKAVVAQSYAAKICGYLPTITSVIAIFNSGYSADAAAVGGAICNAVTNVPLADGPGDHLPRVNGVVVRGKFAK